MADILLIIVLTIMVSPSPGKLLVVLMLLVDRCVLSQCSGRIMLQ